MSHLHSLRHMNYVALFSAAYLFLAVVACYFEPLGGIPPCGEVHLINFTADFVPTFLFQVFTLTCVMN
ncbi:hypothetical protein K488DRAFT_12174, partial [Vararia minispora EC-137]